MISFNMYLRNYLHKALVTSTSCSISFLIVVSCVLVPFRGRGSVSFKDHMDFQSLLVLDIEKGFRCNSCSNTGTAFIYFSLFIAVWIFDLCFWYSSLELRSLFFIVDNVVRTLLSNLNFCTSEAGFV